jgi:hypothetical protein
MIAHGQMLQLHWVSLALLLAAMWVSMRADHTKSMIS